MLRGAQNVRNLQYKLALLNDNADKSPENHILGRVIPDGFHFKTVKVSLAGQSLIKTWSTTLLVKLGMTYSEQRSKLGGRCVGFA